jgi:hypothetical protein
MCPGPVVHSPVVADMPAAACSSNPGFVVADNQAVPALPAMPVLPASIPVQIPIAAGLRFGFGIETGTGTGLGFVLDRAGHSKLWLLPAQRLQ